MSRDKMGSNLVFFLFGAATGAAVALLYAPQDGLSTRRMISEKAVDVKDRANEFTTTVATTARDKWTTAADRIQGLVQRGQVTANTAIDTAAEAAHAGVNSISQ